MLTFDDFDAWGDTVSGASLSLVCDSVETPAWKLGILDLDGVVLQVASEGGGNLCYGGNTHAGPLLFGPLSHATEHVVNGERLDEESLFAIPRGADFRIRVRKRAHSWFSIALPFEVAATARPAATSEKLACDAGSVARLKRLVTEIMAALHDRPAGTAAHRKAGVDLAAAVVDCLPVGRPDRPAAGRPRLDRSTIIRRVMTAIEAGPTVPPAGDLARLAGVTERTLLRAFQESYGLPPKKYLMLRELHRIRRVLAAGAAEDATVADVLVRHGIWEFGRFAGRYRGQFGESPSDTLRRARA